MEYRGRHDAYLTSGMDSERKRVLVGEPPSAALSLAFSSLQPPAADMPKRRSNLRLEPPAKRSRKAQAEHTNRPTDTQPIKKRATQPQAVETLQASAATAQELWQQAIAARSPLVIDGELMDAGWHGSSRWTNEYLKATAGASHVLVEQKSGSNGSFGKGRKVNMTFGQLVQQLHNGNDSLYLTTQETCVDADGQPHVMGAPLKDLRHDFPVRPACMGNLIPQQINLWMGAAPTGASSGLHHDFHDNLYILLRGRKRFRLYPPSEAHNMYTHGRIKHLHPNGRIVYQGQVGRYPL